MSTAVERWGIGGRDLDLIERKARIFAASGLVPVDKPEAAAVVMMRAAAYGLDPADAFEHIHVATIHNRTRVIVSAQLMGAIARRAGCGLVWGDCDATSATLSLTRPDDRTVTTLTARVDDPDVTKLLASKDNWKDFTPAMLRAHVQRNLVRMAAPDVLLGLPYAADVDWQAEHPDDGGDLDVGDPPAAVELGPAGRSNAPLPAGPPIDDDDRDEITRRYQHLDDHGRAYVRTGAQAAGMPWPFRLIDTAGDALAYHRLIGAAETAGAVADQLGAQWQAGHDTQTARQNRGAGEGAAGEGNADGDPTPPHLHDDAPEAAAYEPDDDGRPFE